MTLSYAARPSDGEHFPLLPPKSRSFAQDAACATSALAVLIVPAFQLVDWIASTSPHELQMINAAWRSPVLLLSLVILVYCRFGRSAQTIEVLLRLLSLSIMAMMFGMFAAHWTHPAGDPAHMVHGLIMTTFVVSLLSLKGGREVLAIYALPGGAALAWLAWWGADFSSLWPVLADSGMMLVIAMIASELLFRLRQRSARLESRLRELAATDELTGLQNRRDVQIRINEEMSRSRRHRQSLSILVGDLDYFKRINDTYGHAIGDEVIIAITRRIAAAVRAEDLVGRLGGEEFGVLLVNCSSDDAKARADGIRRAIGETPITVKDQTLTATISIGVASGMASAQDFNSLYVRADEYLYQAKAQGRNRVVADARPWPSSSLAEEHR